MFHAYLRNKFSIVRLLNRPDKNQDYKVTDFLRKKPKAESTILLSNATNSMLCMEGTACLSASTERQYTGYNAVWKHT